VFNFFRRRCPNCKKKRLAGHPSRAIVEGLAEALRVNPAWLCFSCKSCGARFKQRHYGDGQLEPVTDAEWRELVAD